MEQREMKNWMYHRGDVRGRPSNKRVAQDANAWAEKFRRERERQEQEAKK